MRLRLKTVKVGDDLTNKGRLFQTVGLETEKAQIWFLFLEECILGQTNN